MLAQIQNGVGDAFATIVAFTPKLLAFLAILLIGYFVAKAVERIMDRILERVGFDRLVERGGVKRALARSRYDASSLFSRLVYYVIVLFVLQLAFGVFGPNPVSDVLTRVIAYLPRIFVAGLIVVVGAGIAAAVREMVVAAIGGLSYGRMLATAASIAIITVSAFAAVSQLNIAPAIVNALFYAMLAIIAGSAIVAIGGGGIQPMRTYWSRMLSRFEMEAPRVREEAQGSTERIRERVSERAEQAQRMGMGGGAGGSRVRGQRGAPA